MIDLEKAQTKISDIVRNSIAQIITIVVLLAILVLTFVDVDKGSGQINLYQLLINMILVIVIFSPYRHKAKTSVVLREKYKNNATLYAQKVKNIKDQRLLTAFSQYCKQVTSELEHEKRIEILAKACLDIATLQETAGKTKSELLAKYNKVQVKAILKARSKQRIKQVNPTSITADSEGKKPENIDFNESFEDFRSTTSKMVFLVMQAIIGVLIVVVPTNAVGWGMVFTLIMRVVLVVSAAVSGYFSGESFVIKRDRVIKRRIDFIDRFFECMGKDEIGAAVESDEALEEN